MPLRRRQRGPAPGSPRAARQPTLASGGPAPQRHDLLGSAHGRAAPSERNIKPLRMLPGWSASHRDRPLSLEIARRAHTVYIRRRPSDGTRFPRAAARTSCRASQRPHRPPRAAVGRPRRATRTPARARRAARRASRSITSAIALKADRPRGTRARRPRWRRSARTAPCRRPAPPRAPGAGTGTRRDRPARSQRCRPRRGRGRDRQVDALAAVQRVGDRHAHVRAAEVGEHRAVASCDQAVHERLRVHEHVDPLVRRCRTGGGPRSARGPCSSASPSRS